MLQKSVYCVLLLLLLMPGILLAEDDYYGRSKYEGSVFDNTFCFTLGGSHTITSEIRDKAGQKLGLAEPGWIYTYGYKYYMFGSKLGFGMDYTKSSETSAMFSLNAYLRVPVSRKVAIIGGTGWTVTINDSWSSFDIGVGNNVQLGTEFSLASNLSISTILSWYEIEMVDFYTYKTVVEFTSFTISVNLYL